MFEIAQKSAYNLKMNTEEREVVELCDAWVREVGEKGDPNKEIAAFIKRTINETIYNAPDELLDMLFDRGSIGEFDAVEYEGAWKNGLVAYEAAKGGTVPRSWIDFTVLKPVRSNRQIETDLSYVDMRKNGFKSVANLTNFAMEALHNALFYDIFSTVDNGITGGPQLITDGSPNPTMTAMDALALYLKDRNPSGGVAVTLSKYAQAIMRMSNQVDFMSDRMKEEFSRYGFATSYNGVSIASIAGAKKLGTGELLIPDKRIFGIADKIGVLDRVGDVAVYENSDDQKEVIHIMVKNFTHDFVISNPENIAKIELS
jgi:hypothetical protein